MKRVLPILLAAADIALEGMFSDGVSALDAARRMHPDLMVADMCLPLMDGCALAEHVLTGSAFILRPRILILQRQEFPACNRAKLEQAGVVFMPWPPKKEAFIAAVERLRGMRPVFDSRCSADADRLLDELGVPVHMGREALKYAALLCAENERLLHKRSENLYPMLAQMLNVPASAVERALRHVIGAAWQSDKFENQHRIFADTVDAGRGQPTCGEMIARLADILRLEG